MKKGCYFGLLITALLFFVHLSHLVSLIIYSNANIKIIGNEIIFVINLLLVSSILIHIRIKKDQPVKYVEKCMMISGFTHILIAFILPRFSSYRAGPIEIFAIDSVQLADGDLICKGILILILAYVIANTEKHYK